MSSFKEMYAAQNAAGKYVCVGLDPDLSKLPNAITDPYNGGAVLTFLTEIIDRTIEFAAAYKPQSAYYEALGDDGPEVLREVIAYIRDRDPNVPIILDYKRGDIGNTNKPYVEYAFDYLGVDAVTVHPYLGQEAMQPFLDRTDKTIIVLCRTSNSGAGEFQDVMCSAYFDPTTGKVYSTPAQAMREDGIRIELQLTEMPLYQFVALRVARSWNKTGNCAIVVGATYPAELGAVRKVVGDDVMILIPGIGAQGGDLAASISNGHDSSGFGIILNNSSGINFAFATLKNDDGELLYSDAEWGKAAGEAARRMNEAIKSHLTTS